VQRPEQICPLFEGRNQTNISAPAEITLTAEKDLLQHLKTTSRRERLGHVPPINRPTTGAQAIF
jgi:hypothetical protein